MQSSAIRRSEVERRAGKRPGLRFALQEPQLGTGHALLQAEPHLRGRTGNVLLLSGDVPLLRPATLAALVDEAPSARRGGDGADGALVDDPHGYGRIVREGEAVAAIVEEKDATPEERRIGEINSGIYAFDLDPLFDALASSAPTTRRGEYYLPDLVRIYRDTRARRWRR